MNTPKPNDGGPAFPYRDEDGEGGFDQYSGISMRDWFAGQALASCSNWGGFSENGDVIKFTDAAGDCYGMADAMIAERNK